MNRDIYQAITARFIEQLKRGTVPWQKPWLVCRTSFRANPIAESIPCFSAPRTINPLLHNGECLHAHHVQPRRFGGARRHG
jgi:antirestriction protein ArdC